MGVSKQTTFTLTLLMGVSVIVPGCAGYLSARMEAVEQAHRELVSLESRILRERLAAPPAAETRERGQTIAVPGAVPCDIPPRSETRRGKEAIAAGLIPVPADLLPAGSARAEARQQRREAEQERRRRQRLERTDVSEREPAAAESSPPPSTSRRAPEDGGIAGPAQAEVPAN